MININPSNTIVIADFDGTFTKKEVMGKKASALMAILMDEKYLGQAGVEAGQKLFDHYYPIELDPHISNAEKSILMQEWWEKSFAVLRNAKVSREILLEVCHSPLLQWREQLLDFLHLLAKQNIPLIIFSAGGFGNFAINYLLKQAGVLTDNIQIFSNETIFDKQGYFVEAVQPIIHIANKTGHLLIKNGLLDAKPARRQCLLIGDSLDDAQMSEGLDFDLIHKVAFASHNQEHFARNFDLVLPVDGGYGEVIGLFGGAFAQDKN